MKIKIESDVFDICNRIKEIDDGYFILYNIKNNKYEIHNFKQLNSYCLTVPYDELDEKTLKSILETKIEYIDNIIEEIDNNNKIEERKSNESVKNATNYMFREIYNFSNNSSKNYDVSSAFSSTWR